MDGSPTHDKVSGWRSSGSTVSVGGAHPGKTPGPLARHKVNFVLQTAGRRERKTGMDKAAESTRTPRLDVLGMHRRTALQRVTASARRGNEKTRGRLKG